MYQVKFKTSAAKEFQKLPSQVQQRLQIAINHLKTDLRPIGSIKLKGSDDLYRLRVGDYSGVCAGEGRIRWLKPLLSKGFSVLTRLNTAISYYLPD